MRKTLLLTALVTFIHFCSFAQADSLMAMLNDGPASTKKEDVNFTFKATRIINGASVENLGAGVLDFRIEHRFGQLSQGAANFFGLDDATTKLCLDYGINKWLMVGLGHSTLNKEDDGFVKAKILRQQTNGCPITLSYAGFASVQTTPAPILPTGDSYHFSNRLSFTNQILIARKMSNAISVQLMPTIVHYNLIDSTKFSNNTIALGIGGRVKVSNRIAITGEYYLRLTNTDMYYMGTNLPTYNSFSLGIDIETGGHVFQLMFTNSAGITERSFIGQTTDSWTKGMFPPVHFGFNISRVFTVVKPKEFKSGEGKW